MRAMPREEGALNTHIDTRVREIRESNAPVLFAKDRGFCSEFAKISNPLFDPKKVFRHVQFTHLMVTLNFH
jgi:hypothetical protein